MLEEALQAVEGVRGWASGNFPDSFPVSDVDRRCFPEIDLTQGKDNPRVDSLL